MQVPLLFVSGLAPRILSAVPTSGLPGVLLAPSGALRGFVGGRDALDGRSAPSRLGVQPHEEAYLVGKLRQHGEPERSGMPGVDREVMGPAAPRKADGPSPDRKS